MRPCPVCSGSAASVLFADKPHAIVECNRCGMVYADTRRPQSWYSEHYAAVGLYDRDWDDWNARRYREQAERIAGLVLPNSRLLDIGCATGGLLRHLAAFGFSQLHGVDPTQGASLVSINGELVTFAKGGVQQFEGSYDCVVLSHVLEHLLDPLGAVQFACERAGEIHVEVPDASRYCVRESSPYQQFNEEHINHFDLERLTQLFVLTDLNLVACGQGWCAAGPDDQLQTFPTCWAHFERAGTLGEAVSAYCDKSAQLLASITARLEKLQGPVIAWGIGALARRIEPMLRGKVVAAVDASATGEYCGAGVQRPQHTSDGWLRPPVWLVADPPPMPILVTTVLHQDSVLASIRRLKLRNEVLTLE